ncbi:MAG TPA: hypothetical protein VK167_02170 [Flavipsychrobacter sp.]|nr:hypothetical protein [Flavipsychrobacter sp.]
MSKSKSIQISIPQPCHEDWNKMTPTEQGRFCNSCQKCVVDFTTFTDRQLFEYFNKHKGHKICGRFENMQLNRPINIPPQPHSKLYKYFIALGLTLVLTQVPIQDICAKTPYIHISVLSNQPITNEINETDSIVVRGRVLDNYKEPAIGAVIEVSNKGVKTFVTITDEEGYYKAVLNIDTSQSEIELKILYVGFKTQIIKCSKEDLLKPITTSLQLDESRLTGELIIQEYKVPLIDPFNPSNKTFNSDEIEKMPR